MNPQQENTSPSTNIFSSQNGSKVENLLKEEGLKKDDSMKEYHEDGENQEECKVEAEKVDPEKVAQSQQANQR